MDQPHLKIYCGWRNAGQAGSFPHGASALVPVGASWGCGLYLPPALIHYSACTMREMVSVKSTAQLDEQRESKVVSPLRNYAQIQCMNHLAHMFTKELSKSSLPRINSWQKKLENHFSLGVECSPYSVRLSE